MSTRFIDTCCNCNTNVRAYADLLCTVCRRALSEVQEKLTLHSTLDEHVNACRYCRNPRNMCTVGARLRADAIALDGRMDSEYHACFASHDPVIWFKLNREEI